jgi:cell wall-associated NlpC family hydrolase
MTSRRHTRTSRRAAARRRALGAALACAAAGAALGGALLCSRPATATPRELTFGEKPTGVAGLQAEARRIRKEIADLDRRLTASVEEYNTARARLDALNVELMAARRDLIAAEADLQETQTLYGRRLAQMYKGGEMTIIDVLLNADDFTGIARQLDFYRLIAGADQATVARMDALAVEVAEIEASIEERREQALVDELELRDKRALVEDQMTQRQAVLATVSTQIRRELERQAKLAAMTAGELARQAGVVLDTIDATPVQLAVVRATMRWLGVPYVWGGASPSGFDCSGLVTYVYRGFGVDLPHAATMQSRLGDPVPLDRLQPADLVFFGSPSLYNHVGIYVGGGLFIEAPHTGDVVKVSRLAGRGADFAARYDIRLP